MVLNGHLLTPHVIGPGPNLDHAVSDILQQGLWRQDGVPLNFSLLRTDNQTANLPSAIGERLFHDSNMKLWDYDSEALLPNLPKMVTFDNLHNFYEVWRKDLVSKGVDIRLNTGVTQILTRTSKGVLIQTAPVNKDNHSPSSSSNTNQELFDEMVLCVLVDDAIRLLDKTATRREHFVLSGAKFYDNITVTHWDSDYFQRHHGTFKYY